MIEPVAVKLIWAGAILAAYGLFRWRWLVAMQDFVISAVEDAERWAQSTTTSAFAKDLVERFSNAAYRPSATWRIALLVSCGVVFAVVRNLHRNSPPAQDEAAEEEARMTFRLLVAVLTTSPIALVLVFVVFCFGLLLQGSVRAVLGLIPEATVFGRLHQPST
ncbi:MAG: hypothetical protein OXU77_22745 [Gammaproteobacteria bacterium]|nr:hypothetical protein [Gammaproteobacteria bacterium]